MPMSTPMAGPRRKRPPAFWATPAVSVLLGVAMGAGAWAGGDRGLAVFAVALMTGVAVALVVASRWSETVNGLLDRRDERIASLDRDATLVAGTTVILGVIAGFVFELARGGDAWPYIWLGALGGVTYLVALVVLRLRR